jgi:alpha-N-arabinofuranosidase
VGNEDWFDKSGSYDQRFAQFHGHQGAVSAAQGDLDGRIRAAQGLRVHSVKPDVLDEHYYRTVDVF